MSERKNYHNYITVARLPLDEVVDVLLTAVDKSERRLLAGYNVKVASLRLVTFKVKGTACQYCGLQATHFELNDNHTKVPRELKPHLNLWAGNVLMTKDHINPSSNDGKDHIGNMATCCEDCNSAKGSLVLPSVEALIP